MNANDIILISQEDRRSYLLDLNNVLNTEGLDTTIYHVATWGELQDEHGEDAENLLSPAIDTTTLGAETPLYYAGYMREHNNEYTANYIDPRDAAAAYLTHDSSSDIVLLDEAEAIAWVAAHPNDATGVAEWL